MATFDQIYQKVKWQYNVNRNINIPMVNSLDELRSELTKLRLEVLGAKKSG